MWRRTKYSRLVAQIGFFQLRRLTKWIMSMCVMCMGVLELLLLVRVHAKMTVYELSMVLWCLTMVGEPVLLGMEFVHGKGLTVNGARNTKGR